MSGVEAWPTPRAGVALGILSAAALCVGGCGSAPATELTRDRASVAAVSKATVDAATHSAILHFARGRRVLRFRLVEPEGVILLYRLSAPTGVRGRASAQLPGVTVPLLIATRPTGPSSSCVEGGGERVVCTVGEEWCPMPAGSWRFRVEKLDGHAGDVVISSRVGVPRRRT